MFNINDAFINALQEQEHNLRTPYDRSRGQINSIVELCDEIKTKTGKDIAFNNIEANNYKLIIDGKEFSFTIYRDVINALNVLMLFI